MTPTGYAYNGDVYCPECIPDNECSEDCLNSDCCPQPFFSTEETDSERYCSSCFEYIDTTLTRYGLDSLTEGQYDMWVSGPGFNPDMVTAIAMSLNLCTDNTRMNGRRVYFRLLPESSHSRYARTTATGRKLRACCFHGFRDFIRECFKLGATAVGSSIRTISDGDSPSNRWNNIDQFERDIPELAHMNLGSEYHPVDMFDLCQCKEREAAGVDTPSPMDFADWIQLDDVHRACYECGHSLATAGHTVARVTYRRPWYKRPIIVELRPDGRALIWRQNWGYTKPRPLTARTADKAARFILRHVIPAYVVLPEITVEVCYL